MLGRWAARPPTHRTDLHFGVTSLILSLRTNFDPSLAAGVACEVTVRCGEDTFLAHVAEGALSIGRGEPVDPGADITGDPAMIASVVYGGRPLPDAESAGDVIVAGDHAVAERFLGLYSLPAKAL